MKNKLIVITSLIYLLAISGYTIAQPISRTEENAATQQLIKEQISKPLSALDWYNKGAALNNNSDEELAAYQKAVQINPEFAPAYYNMGIIYMKRSMNAQAIGSFNKFLLYSNNEAKKQQIRKILAELGVSAPNYPAGVPKPTTPTDLRQKATQLYNQGIALNNNSNEEMQYYLQALALYPGFASAHMNLGLVYYNRKNYKNALSELTKYIEYTNDPPEKRKEVLKLIEWLKTVIKSSPQQSAPAMQTKEPAQLGSQPVQNNSNRGGAQIREVPLQ